VPRVLERRLPLADHENQQHEEWVPYKDYKAPTQSTIWQVIDVLFVIILCYICLLIPILLTGKMIVG
jgi:hypothetical protein